MLPGVSFQYHRGSPEGMLIHNAPSRDCRSCPPAMFSMRRPGGRAWVVHVRPSKRLIPLSVPTQTVPSSETLSDPMPLANESPNERLPVLSQVDPLPMTVTVPVPVVL